MVIHYCWFGRGELPEEAKKCIASWKKYCPEYEIKEWNENNYDVNKNKYMGQAYKQKKYAFVSDYARLDIIYNEGGVYFDVDVELIKNIDELIKKGPFLGCEKNGRLLWFLRHKKNRIAVAPGLVIYAEKNNNIIKDILESYTNEEFVDENGKENSKTIVTRTTEVLLKRGMIDKKGIQYLDNMTIYPKCYFCPLDYYTGTLKIKKNTYSIHRYVASWQSEEEKKLHDKTKKIAKVFGSSIAYNICIFCDNVKKEGVIKACKAIIKKLKKQEDK